MLGFVLNSEFTNIFYSKKFENTTLSTLKKILLLITQLRDRIYIGCFKFLNPILALKFFYPTQAGSFMTPPPLYPSIAVKEGQTKMQLVKNLKNSTFNPICA